MVIPLLNLFPVDAYDVLSSCQVYEKVAYLLTNLGERCPHAACIYTLIISCFPDVWQTFIFSLNPCFSPLRAPTDRV